MTSRDIALEMLVTRPSKDDQKLLPLMTKRVGVALRTQRLNGLARSKHTSGLLILSRPLCQMSAIWFDFDRGNQS
jgi:hypothetical protein